MLPDKAPSRPGRRSRRGQAMVETALMLPLLLILLLGAIDFGRLFFSWVSLHQAARIAANHASIDTTTTSADIPALIASETAGMNCAQGTPTLQYTSGGSATTSPQLGDYAHVTLSCDFSLLIPLSGLLFGDPIHMTALSSFPVRTGALGLGSGGGGTTPPPPPEQCRLVPEFAGMSIGGARSAWESAGFIGSFTTTASDVETVDEATVVITPLDEACTAGYEIFNASIQVGGLAPEGSPPGPTDCQPIPNLVGLSLADAEDAWEASDFTGSFGFEPPEAAPDGIVTDQTTLDDGTEVTSEPGVTCMDLVTEIEVIVGDPLPDPPDTPCQVPHLIDKTRTVGSSEWYANGFAPATFSPTSGNFKIKSQSLVGFSWVPCGSTITVAADAG